MAEMASLWSYLEGGEVDQLGQKLLSATLELEKLKLDSIEETKKNNDYINQLIHLVKSAIQERDEARNNLQKLAIAASAAGGGSPAPMISENFPATKIFRRANSGVTESSSLSHGGAAASSPELESAAAVDRGSVVVENIARGRFLPEKGRLLKAVLQAGPLLQTVMVAGPLPRWRNPPEMQAFPAGFEIDCVNNASLISNCCFGLQKRQRLC